jgi:hypothetical protein
MINKMKLVTLASILALSILPAAAQSRAEAPSQTRIATVSSAIAANERSILCQPSSVKVAGDYIQIACKNKASLEGPIESSIWIIRSDGSAPNWALKSESFAALQTILLKPETMMTARFGSKGSWSGWQFTTRKNAKPPAKYCVENISCYDLASYQYWVPMSR